ncbi:MAG TPA: glycoside hydrolase family 27 protein [bacterium]|nr:glycoside hydrolase family 27 protein [bacterium]HPN44057.1 glycoside hydrolase family 27 protein [bacterium]
MKKIVVLVLMLLSVQVYAQKFKGLALTPPMGWNSWNKFACDVNEKVIRDCADAMVKSGLKDAGYKYIVIDDCWHGERDSLGFIQADPQRFPSGMKALADYIHSLGLKFGIYSDAGWKTCGGRPGSRGREYQDAYMYAKWGIDYLKYDWCNTEGLNAEGAYMTMRDALYAAGRPIVFSLCEWGNNDPWKWGKNVGHLWRTTGDIAVLFDGEEKHPGWSSWGVLQIIDMRQDIRQYAGPDHWNDPDMMEVGNGMSVNEDRAHFSMWCMQAAPLMAGNDLANMSKETLEILTNKEAIAVDQDTLGIQGFSYAMNDKVEIWFKPLQNDEWAVCFLNRNGEAKPVEFTWSEHKVIDSFANREADFTKTTYKIRDLWAKKDIGKTDKKLTTTLPGHDVLMFRLTPVK